MAQGMTARGCLPFGAWTFLHHLASVRRQQQNANLAHCAYIKFLNMCEWDNCQTLPPEDTLLSGLGLLRKSWIPPPGQAALGYLSLHCCATFCLPQLYRENWGIYLYLCAPQRHRLAKDISFLAVSSQEKHLNLPGTMNSPKSGTEKEAERNTVPQKGYLRYLQMSWWRL